MRSASSGWRAAGLVLAGWVVLAPSPADAQQRVVTCPAPGGIVGPLVQPLAAVRYLADDLLDGRLSGTDGERCTAEYIAREFQRIGLRPGGIAGGYLQPVELASVVSPHAPPGVGYNVVGILEGSDPALRGEVVVLGAHHDHLGRGEFFGSLAGADVGPNQIHNGADDNASGVGALLAAAEALARRPPARSVIFVTFSGEESGLLGSARFVQDPPVATERMEAMINLDMVGRLGNRPLIVNGTGTAAEWNDILDRLENQYGIQTARAPEGFGPSDHTSFYARDIPVLHYFTNVHGEYHHPNDDWWLVDAAGLARIALLVEGTIREVADRPEGLTHLAGAGAPATMVSTGNRAYFGSVPDFAPVDYGVRFSGVTAGSPAAEAGLRAGDVLIRLGEWEVRDLYVMTEALDTLRAGTTVEATVLRNGETITVPVLLRERPGN